MPQFAVYKNRNAATRGRFPLLLDVQSELLEPLSTRVVVPLSPIATARDVAMRQLAPILTSDGKQYVMLTPQLAGVSARGLGQSIGTVAHERATIIAALDLLVTGI
jgi:toxin CcdB